MVTMDCSAFRPKDVAQVPFHHTADIRRQGLIGILITAVSRDSVHLEFIQRYPVGTTQFSGKKLSFVFPETSK